MAHYTKELISTSVEDGVDTHFYKVEVYSDADHTQHLRSMNLHAIDGTDLDAAIDDFMTPVTEQVKTPEQKRKEAYPSIEDQLDKMFHDGFDAWKAEIQAIKDKYPK